MHCTRKEFKECVKSGGIFMLDKGSLFYGTIDEFKNCFFDNATYDNICDFADEFKCFVEIEK